MQALSVDITPFAPPVISTDLAKKSVQVSEALKNMVELTKKTQAAQKEDGFSKRELSRLYFECGKAYETCSYYTEKRENTINMLNNAFICYDNSAINSHEIARTDGGPRDGIMRVGKKLGELGVAKLANPDTGKEIDPKSLQKKKCVIL